MSDLANRFEKYIFESKTTNEDLVQILNLCVEYLNLIPINEFSKQVKESYNGILKSPKYKKVIICNKTFIINN